MNRGLSGVLGVLVGRSPAKKSLVSINNSANAVTLTNYPVRVNVAKKPRMRSDFSDVRFMSETGMALAYWRESYVLATSAVFWVKIPSIAGSSSSTAIVMVYGRGQRAANGNDVFTLFEDFTSPLLGAISPVGSSYPEVIKSGSTYYMIVDNQTTNSKDLHTAQSINGPWTPYASNPVLAHGTGVDFDSARCVWGSLGLDGTTYYIFYAGNNGTKFSVGVATSSDLISWTKYASNPILTEGVAWEGTQVIGPEILTDLVGNIVQYGGKYWLAYINFAATDIGMASADTLTGPWTKYAGNPVLSKGSAGQWDVTNISTCSFKVENGVYYLFYEGYKTTTGVWASGIATASSPTGTWTKYAGNPVLSPQYAWENNAAIDPVIRKYDGVYYLFYTGNGVPTSTTSQNNYATASNILGPYITQPMKFNKTVTPTAVAGILQLNATDSLTSIATFQYAAMRARVNWKSNQGGVTNLKWIGFINGAAGARAMISTTHSQAQLYAKNFIASASDIQIQASLADTYVTYEMLWKSGEVRIYINDILSATNISQVPSTSIPVSLYNYEDATYDLLADFVLVRQYSDPEPVATVL